MPKFEDPSLGSAQIYEEPDLFQVRVKSKTRVFITIFLAFWLCGWAFGELMVLTTLLSGNTGGATVFLLAWLGAWTVGGLFVLSQVLWGIAGYELLSVSKNVLTIQRHIPLYRRSWAYDISHVTNARMNTSASREAPLGGKQNFHGLFSNRSQGMIKFDYGKRTPAFGMELEEAEAREVLGKLSARLEAS